MSREHTFRLRELGRTRWLKPAKDEAAPAVKESKQQEKQRPEEQRWDIDRTADQ